jgi:hypothetical protein
MDVPPESERTIRPMPGKTTSQIDLADLREAVSRLLDAAETRFGPTPDLAADHYWVLELSEMFSLDRQPSANAGQLSDDVESIREFLSRPEGETFLWHDLQHVAGVLLRLASLDLPDA